MRLFLNMLMMIAMTSALTLHLPSSAKDLVSESIAANKADRSANLVLTPIVQKYLPVKMRRAAVESYLKQKGFDLMADKAEAVTPNSTLYARYRRPISITRFLVEEEIHLVVTFVDDAVQEASGKYIYRGP